MQDEPRTQPPSQLQPHQLQQQPPLPAPRPPRVQRSGEMRRGAARCDGGGGDGGAGGVSGSGAGVKVIAHMRNGELLSGTIADDIVGSVSSSAAGVSNKVVMATEATDGRFSQEQRTMEEVDSGGRNRRSKKSGTCSGSSGGCGGYGSAYGHHGSGGVSGSGGRDGSGRGGGGVDAVEEIEVGIYAYQGDRASAEDGDSESDHARNDGVEENGDGDGYDSVSVEDENDADDALSDTACADEVLSDGCLSHETLSEGAWCDEDQQPVPPRRVPATPRSPPPVGLQKQRSASQAVVAVLESSTVLPLGSGSASRGCGSTSGPHAAVDYLCFHDLEASLPRRMKAEPSQTGPASTPPTLPALRLAASGPEHVLRSPSSVTDSPTSCLLYTSPSPRDGLLSRMPSSA